MSNEARDIDWAVSRAPVAYEAAVLAMERRVARIAEGRAPEMIWLLEHPACYTAGTSAKASDLVQPSRFPVYSTGRGGQFSYHGPGQRVVYTMLDLRRRFGGDARAFVAALERALILTLARFGVEGGTRPGRVGVWVRRSPIDRAIDEKIAAIGVRVRRGVSFHGASLNVAPDLAHYGGIVPCGLADFGVTSLAALGCAAPLAEVDTALRLGFETVFGAARPVASPSLSAEANENAQPRSTRLGARFNA